MLNSTNRNKTQTSMETYYRNLISKILDKVGFNIESEAYNETYEDFQNPTASMKSFNKELHDRYIAVAQHWIAEINNLKSPTFRIPDLI